MHDRVPGPRSRHARVRDGRRVVSRMARAAQRFALGIEVARPLAAIRAWARGEAPALGVDEARRLLSLPTPSDQQARAEFGLGHWLWERGEREAAGRHFVRAGELAP